MEKRTRLISTWLFVSAALVVAMVAVGGVTRLTRSGLSIVEWNPVSGVLPPMSETAWQSAYTAYQASPEGRLINPDLSVDGFKRIFLVEWFHRLLGRSVGVFFFVPWLFFAVRRWITRAQAVRFIAWFGLGGLQGVFGWLMVKSGLTDAPHVSPYWLTAHLLTALIVYVLLLWEALELRRPRASLPRSTSPAWPTRAFLAALVLAVTWGGLMAGFKAGWLSDTFPKMAGEWVPSFLWADTGLGGVASNAFLVHFTHRVLGLGVVALAIVVFATTRHARSAERRTALALMLFALLQATLGAVTVWLQVPIVLAALHQVNAAFLLGVSVTLVFLQARAPATVTAELPAGGHDRELTATSAGRTRRPARRR